MSERASKWRVPPQGDQSTGHKSMSRGTNPQNTGTLADILRTLTAR